MMAVTKSSTADAISHLDVPASQHCPEEVVEDIQR
jgi:hypothetical protein